MTRYALYILPTSRSRHGHLACVMLNERAAELHADALCATRGYAAVIVRPVGEAERLPERIKA